MNLFSCHSHLGGLECLLVRKPNIWNEIGAIIKSTDRPTALRCPEDSGMNCFSEMSSAHQFADGLQIRFQQQDWQTPLGPSGQGLVSVQPGVHYFVKDGVGISIQLSRPSNIRLKMLTKHLVMYLDGLVDIGIEILPLKSLQEEMSSGVPYYEGELYDLIREGRGVPAVPLILIGVAP